MVKLEQVSILDFADTYLSLDEKNELLREGITNYKELGAFILSHPKWKKSKAWEHYLFVKTRINQLGKDVKPVIYEIPVYSDESLEYNDKLVKGSSLILNNPTTTNVGLTESLAKISIREIKYRAKYVNVFFKNMLESYNYVNSTRAKKVVSALWLYNAQIERQAKEIQRRDVSLFDYLLEDRRKLVNDQIVNIIDYLLENADKGFVWGELTPTQKKKYISALTNDFIPDMMLKDNLVEYIASNVTFTEADRDLTSDHTLDRFILR